MLIIIQENKGTGHICQARKPIRPTSLLSRHTLLTILGNRLYRREQYIQPQEPRSHTTELPFGGGTQSRYPPNSKHYGQPSAGGQPFYQQNNPAGYPPMSHQNAPHDDYNQGSYGSHGSHAMSQSGSQGDVNQRSGYHMGQQYNSGHGDQRSFQSGQNPNYDDQRNRQGGSEIKYPPRLDHSMSYGSQDYPSNDLRDPSSQFNSHPPSQYSGAGGAYPSASNDQYPQSYQQQSYQRQQHEQQPGGGNQGYGRPGNFGGADQHPQQPGAGNQRHGGGLVIMEQLVTMEWLVTTVELIILHKVLAVNICQDKNLL